MGLKHIHYAYWLSCVHRIGSVKRNRLLEYFGNEEEIFNASKEQLSKVNGIGSKDIESLISGRDSTIVEESYGKMLSQDIRFVHKGDAIYPERLYNIYDAPYCLFYKGILPDSSKKTVAIVGARNVSYSGSIIANRMGRQLAENGIQIISGLARGVDVYAQNGAISIAGNKTFAVLGCGVDICYPRQNIETYMLIQESGGIISEYPPGTPPLSGNFPMRNRIISAFSDGVLIIEASERSGSLITAEYAIEQGKDIFAVPGEIGNKLYYGSNQLIKDGAALVTDVSDILDALGIFYDCNIKNICTKKITLVSKEKIVYSSLGLNPAHISEISVRAGLNITQTMEVLISLELKNLVCMVGNNYYAVKI